MPEAGPASPSLHDSSLVFQQNGAELVHQVAPEATDHEVHVSSHTLWLDQVVVARIGSILGDETLGEPEREASLKDLNDLLGGVGIGTLAFANLLRSAQQSMVLEEGERTRPVEVEDKLRLRYRIQHALGRAIFLYRESDLTGKEYV